MRYFILLFYLPFVVVLFSITKYTLVSSMKMLFRHRFLYFLSQRNNETLSDYDLLIYRCLALLGLSGIVIMISPLSMRGCTNLDIV